MTELRKNNFMDKDMRDKDIKRLDKYATYFHFTAK